MSVPLDTDARMYCDEADVTTRIDISDLPTVNLGYLIRSVTARIERETGGRVFQQVPASGTEARDFMVARAGWRQLFINDLLTLSSITVDGDAVDVDDLFLMPVGETPTTWLEYQAMAEWTPRVVVEVTGTWGYSEDVPWEVWDACVVLCVRALQRAKSAYQDASAMPELGELVYAMALPAEVKATLNGLRKVPL